MKGQIAEKDRNTTDLRLAFVFHSEKVRRSFPGCFSLAGQPREPNYGFLLVTLEPPPRSLSPSFFLAAGGVHLPGYGSCSRGSSSGGSDPEPLGQVNP